ncbi:putative ABC transporter [Stipitochalara longipes BDJ]|nr:putative ABC transporter [Stipitochalara longipes BDJ]
MQPPLVHVEKGPASSPQEFSLRGVIPVDIRINDLTVALPVKQPKQRNKTPAYFEDFFNPQALQEDPEPAVVLPSKKILHGIHAHLASGTLTAILGASGSGKTSLLNSMSHRFSSKQLQTSGAILYNRGDKLSSVRSTYVMQHDVLLPTLTVRETLQYAAELRLPASTSAEERHAIVEEVLLELGLKECADTRIGNSEHKGCSGGEKRRTSLAVQLLANPSVLFLDEVTTGLDATTALQLVATLKQLARQGRTIVVTLHQPRSQMWDLFDNILLLSGGSLVYGGPQESCIPYFSDLGYPLPAFVNPNEHIIDLAAIDTRSSDAETASQVRVKLLKEAWKRQYQPTDNEKSTAHVATRADAPRPSRSSFQHQVRVQTSRTIKTAWRDPFGISGSLSEALLLGLITGWVFLNIDESLTGIRSRIGALYTAAVQQGFLILIFEIYRLAQEIPVFDQEHIEGVVSVSSFLLSRRLARLLIEDIPVPLIFSVIFYFMAGFRHFASQFFIFFVLTLLSHYLAVTLAMFCIAVSRNFAGASMIANLMFTVQTLCSGFFVQSNQIPVYLRWLKYVAYVWYANGAFCANEFISHTSNPTGQLYACPYPGGSSNPECKPYTGVFIMQSLGFPYTWTYQPFFVLVSFALAFYGGAALLFTYREVESGVVRTQKLQPEVAKRGDQVLIQAAGNARAIEIILDKYGLRILKRMILGRKPVIKTLLTPITTKFEAGKLNVIIGPSGSGKTSLLNSLANRTRDTIGILYKKSGAMLYNGAAPSEDVVRSVSSYVCQDDDALLPTLTVRETLRFAACLRLPTWMSKRDKIQRAETVLQQLGLKDCADTLVGSHLIKGISGGEKRRVSIATQILTDPRILLLDEPTSGLDSFTASSIIDMLASLAKEGRTIVFTIHQPGSNLFHHFDNILLLARGGFPIFSGKGVDMLPYFSNIGFQCSENTNPTDFALDLITVNLQASDKEAISREKVEGLIAEWQQRGTSTAPAVSSSDISTPAELGSFKRAMTPFWVAFPLLIKRSLLNFRRDGTVATARISQVLGYGVIVSLFFAPLKKDYDSIQSRFGFIQELVAIYFVGMLQNIAVYPVEKKIFYNEYEDRSYPLPAFFLSYTLLEIPFEILTSLLFSVFGTFAVGFPRTGSLYFTMAFNIFCVVSCGESVGIMFNTLFDHTGFAINITSILISVAVLMAGVYSLNLPTFLQAFNHLSPVKWAVGNLAPYSMHGLTFSCSVSQQGPTGLCPITTGEQALQLYNLNHDPKMYLVALGACTIGYRLVSFLLLWAVKR